MPICSQDEILLNFATCKGDFADAILCSNEENGYKILFNVKLIAQTLSPLHFLI